MYLPAMLSAGIEGAQVGELAERIIPVTPRLILRVGGSGTSPVIPWNGSTRISSRPIEQQIEYAPFPELFLRSDFYREAKAAVNSLQREFERLERQIVQGTTELRELRKNLQTKRKTAQEAQVSKQRTEAALEEVNEYLSSQDPASGLMSPLKEPLLYHFS